MAAHHRLEQLLRRLNKAEGMGYLQQNSAELATGFPDSERYQVLGRILHLGMGRAIPGVVQQWSSSLSECIDRIYELLSREAMPALYRAMRQDDAKTAVQAWYEPVRESGLLTMVAPRLAALLDLKDSGSSMLAWSINRGRAVAVEAFFGLLKDLLTDRSVQSHMKDALPDILLTKQSVHEPALSVAMAMGYTRAVKAFYAGIKDLLTDPTLDEPIRSRLLEALPKLLTGNLRSRDSGLAYALQIGQTEVIEVLHDVLKDLLSDALIGPHLRTALPDMLIAKASNDEPGVSIARRVGHGATLTAFLALLADPAIQPHIGPVLRDYLAAGPAPTDVDTPPAK